MGVEPRVVGGLQHGPTEGATSNAPHSTSITGPHNPRFGAVCRRGHIYGGVAGASARRRSRPAETPGGSNALVPCGPWPRGCRGPRALYMWQHVPRLPGPVRGVLAGVWGRAWVVSGGPRG